MNSLARLLPQKGTEAANEYKKQNIKQSEQIAQITHIFFLDNHFKIAEKQLQTVTRSQNHKTEERVSTNVKYKKSRTEKNVLTDTFEITM